MQENWEEKQAKVFMIIRLSKTLLFGILLYSCESGLQDDPIPITSFDDLVINLSFPEYANLSSDGGFKDISNLEGGVRGIILYRKSATTYLAFEKNCSYTPNQACATVEVHSSGLFLIDPCCTSSFSFEDGVPTGGPAWRPLLQYRAQLNGSLLTITDEIVD